MIAEVLTPKEKAPVHKEANQKMEYRYFGSIQMKRGLKLYQFHTETGMLEEVRVSREVIVDLKGREIKRAKATYDPECIYFQALNMKNARRKVLKLIELYCNQK